MTAKVSDRRYGIGQKKGKMISNAAILVHFFIDRLQCVDDKKRFGLRISYTKGQGQIYSARNANSSHSFVGGFGR